MLIPFVLRAVACVGARSGYFALYWVLDEVIALGHALPRV